MAKDETIKGTSQYGDYEATPRVDKNGRHPVLRITGIAGLEGMLDITNRLTGTNGEVEQIWALAKRLLIEGGAINRWGDIFFLEQLATKHQQEYNSPLLRTVSDLVDLNGFFIPGEYNSKCKFLAVGKLTASQVDYELVNGVVVPSFQTEHSAKEQARSNRAYMHYSNTAYLRHHLKSHQTPVIGPKAFDNQLLAVLAHEHGKKAATTPEPK